MERGLVHLADVDVRLGQVEGGGGAAVVEPQLAAVGGAEEDVLVAVTVDVAGDHAVRVRADGGCEELRAAAAAGHVVAVGEYEGRPRAFVEPQLACGREARL